MLAPPVLLLALALGAAGPQLPRASTARGGTPLFPFPAGQVETVNLIQWDANALPRIYERSDQLPLTDEDVAKLARAGFTPPQLVRMLEERRCACDASADGLVRLKEAGVPAEVLAAVSTHALAPNRALTLELTLDFTGESQTAREGFLYFFVDDGELTRVFSANLPQLLGRRNAHELTVDRSDILQARSVRRIRLAGDVPLKTYGRHTVLVAASASPVLTHPSQLTATERTRARTYTFDYPRASLQSLCRLGAGWRRDAVLVDKWRFVGSRFECEWN